MNNKGFMMAEVIVVAAIILVTMVGLYASYNKIFSLYNKRVDYYDVATLYELGDIRDNVDLASYVSKSEVPIGDSMKKVYYVASTKEEIIALSEVTSINATFKDYLVFLSDSINVDTDNILVMERCVDSDNCMYAYLEVF